MNLRGWKVSIYSQPSNNINGEVLEIVDTGDVVNLILS